MAQNFRMLAAAMLVVGFISMTEAIPMAKVEIAEKAIEKAEAEAAAADADSPMPDAEIAIAADAVAAEDYAPAADAAAKEESAPTGGAKEEVPKEAPVVEKKEEEKVPTPKAKEEDAPPPAAETEAPKEAKPAAADADTKVEAAPADEKDAAPVDEEPVAVVAAEEKKEDDAVPADDVEKGEEAEKEEGYEENEEGYEEEEDEDDDDERLYADQEEDFEDEDDLSKDEVKAKGKDAGQEYQRYLSEQRKALQADPEKRAHMVKLLTEIEERDGKLEDEQKTTLEIARAIQQEEDARSRLEEQERELIDQQRRQAARDKRERAGLKPKANEFNFKDKDREVWMSEDGVDHKALVDIAKRRASQMGHLDRNRRVAFMQHEMKRLLKFKETIDNTADSTEKETLLAEHEAENEELAKRRSAAPGSREQLAKVWEEEDGLEKESFDPKTFFRLHDITGDGVLDVKELEAMFFREASKLHTIRMRKQGKDAKTRTGKDREQDKFVVREEMARMREHVMKNADEDGDGTINMEEWLAMSAKREFDSKKKDWKPVAPEAEMTDKQLANFKKLQAKLAQSKHKEMDPKMLAAAKRMRKQLNPKQKEALKALQRQRSQGMNKEDRDKINKMKKEQRNKRQAEREDRRAVRDEKRKN